MAKQDKMSEEEPISLIDQHVTDSVYYGDENNVSGSRLSIFLKHGANAETYDSGAVDFFDLVVLPVPTIYIVPFDVISGLLKCSVYPINPDSAGRLEIYRENWDLL